MLTTFFLLLTSEEVCYFFPCCMIHLTVTTQDLGVASIQNAFLEVINSYKSNLITGSIILKRKQSGQSLHHPFPVMIKGHDVIGIQYCSHQQTPVISHVAIELFEVFRARVSHTISFQCDLTCLLFNVIQYARPVFEWYKSIYKSSRTFPVHCGFLWLEL